MFLSILIIIIGLVGFILNNKNLILLIISLEIMILGSTLLILLTSLEFDDLLGQLYAIFIIAIAGAESAIGLGLLIRYYKMHESILISSPTNPTNFVY